MKKILVLLVSVLSVFQIGCDVPFEDPKEFIVEPLTSTLANNIDGFFITSLLCADNAYETAKLDKLYITIKPKVGAQGLSSVSFTGSVFETFIIDTSKQVNNMSISSSTLAQQDVTYASSKELCESGTEIIDSSNSIKLIRSGHIINNDFNTNGFALSLKPYEPRSYMMSVNYSEYKCINSVIVNVKEDRENIDLFKVTESEISSAETLRAIYDEQCPNN